MPSSDAAHTPASTGNPYWDQLLAEANHLRAVNARLAEGMLLRDDLTADERTSLSESMGLNRHQIDVLERQVAWYRHMAGELVWVVPHGPQWAT